ncbi:MAG: NUDIX domain-containing protein [Pseudomonadota bacterium]|nr:NUDIX domain-containing protein [Pseudomonadota bacterium]
MTLPTHKSVRILLLNDTNELLLVCAEDPTTGSKDGKVLPCFWFTIGGQIESGETLLAAAQRELYEEAGLEKDDIVFGPIVWYGEYEMILSGVLTRMQQQFIVAHTNNSNVSLHNLTVNEQEVLKKLAWFNLEQIKTCKQVIYPVILPSILPDILNKQYPESPIWVDLGRDPA